MLVDVVPGDVVVALDDLRAVDAGDDLTVEPSLGHRPSRSPAAEVRATDSSAGETRRLRLSFPGAARIFLTDGCRRLVSRPCFSNPTGQDDAVPNLGIAPSSPWLSVSAGRGASDARHS